MPDWGLIGRKWGTTGPNPRAWRENPHERKGGHHAVRDPARARRSTARRDTPSTTALKRDVGVDLDVWIAAPTTLEFQIAVAPQPGAEVTESLSFTLNGKEIQATEIIGDHGNRIHKFDAGEGSLLASYSATIIGQSDPAPVTEIDLSTYLRPSRYAEADKFFGFAATNSANTPTRRRCWRRCRRGWAPGCTTCPARRTRSTAPSTRCWPARACAATTRTWWSHCCVR